MEEEITRLTSLLNNYKAYLKTDYDIISHQIPIEVLEETKSSNDILTTKINDELKKTVKKYEYVPLPYITDKMMGKIRVIKNSKNKVIHKLPIKSVDKMTLGDKLSNYFTDINSLIVMPKYDGVSCICWNNKESNSLTFATKSSDTQGENITEICTKIVDVNKIKKYFKSHPELIGIRGELILDNSYVPNTTRLAELNGLLRSKEPNLEMFPYLHIVFYFVYIDTEISTNKKLYGYLHDLQNYAEVSKVYAIPKNMDEVNEKEMALLIRKFKVNYDSDGFIFRYDNLNFDSSLAVKKEYYFEAEITGIEFILANRLGTYVPKLHIKYDDKSINKTITKVHGYNLNYLFTNNIQIGSIVLIKYTGDTIAVIDRLVKKGFPKTLTINKYIKYIYDNATGLEKATVVDNDFIGVVDCLYNFIKKQCLIGGGTIRIKEYLNAIYPDRLTVEDKKELYKTFIDIIKQDQYTSIHGMPIETIRLFSKNMSIILKNKKKVIESTIEALSIPLLTYINFNKCYSHLVFKLDENEHNIIEITKAYKAVLNATSQIILDNKDDFIFIYNMFLNF